MTHQPSDLDRVTIGTDEFSMTDFNSDHQQLADSLIIHGLLAESANRNPLRDDKQIDAVLQRIHRESAEAAHARILVSSVSRVKRLATWSFAAAVATSLLIGFMIHEPAKVSASSTLRRLIEVATQPMDRTYRVRVTEEYSTRQLPRGLRNEPDRKPIDPIDGATLHLRGPNEFVFIQTQANGKFRIRGCDSTNSWAFKERGPVHLSHDLRRYRGGIPGEQNDLPLIDMSEHLEQLRAGYDLSLRDDTSVDEHGTKLLILAAARKSPDIRGAKAIDIWFEPESGLVHQMFLDGLPRRGGGPKSVLLVLVNTDTRGEEFYQHTSHHDGQRFVIHEDN